MGKGYIMRIATKGILNILNNCLSSNDQKGYTVGLEAAYTLLNTCNEKTFKEIETNYIFRKFMITF